MHPISTRSPFIAPTIATCELLLDNKIHIFPVIFVCYVIIFIIVVFLIARKQLDLISNANFD